MANPPPPTESVWSSCGKRELWRGHHIPTPPAPETAQQPQTPQQAVPTLDETPKSGESASIEDADANNQSLTGPESINAAAFRSAASELREGETADGGGSEGAQDLLKWGRKSGRIVPDSDFENLPPLSNSTSEHEVFYQPETGRVIKRTWPGFYGQVPTPEDGALGRRVATPSEYLERQALQNEVFGSDLRLEGVHASDRPSMIIGEPAGQPSFVVSQGFLESVHPDDLPPTTEQISDFMHEHGFREAPKSYFGWYRPADATVVVDAKPDNFVLTAEGVRPIDLQMAQFTPEEMQSAGLYTGE